MRFQSGTVWVTWRTACYSEAQSCIQRFAFVPDRCFFDLPPNSFSDVVARIQRAIRQQRNDLLASTPVHISTISHYRARNTKYLPENFITVLVSVIGIEAFEFINISQNKRDRLTIRSL